MKLPFRHRPAARRSGAGSRWAWFRQHRSSIVDSLKYLHSNPESLVLSILVIGVTLSLPLSLRVLQENVLLLTRDFGTTRHVSLFLTLDSTLDDADALATTLAADDRVRDARVIGRDEALAELRASADLGAAIASLEDNPLPHAVVLEVDAEAFAGPDGEAFEVALRQTPRVADAAFDITWIRRLDAITHLVERTALAFALIIALAVVLITGHIVRTGIHNRREEIEVAKLCGATDAYVSRPFLYNGAAQGFGGALIACAIVSAALLGIRGPAEALADAYGPGFDIATVSGALFVTTLLAGTLMGWLGAWIAVKLYIRRVDLGGFT